MLGTGAVAAVVAAGRELELADVPKELILWLATSCGFAMATASISMLAAMSKHPSIGICMALGVAVVSGWGVSAILPRDQALRTWMLWFQLVLAALIFSTGTVLRLYGYRWQRCATVTGRATAGII